MAAWRSGWVLGVVWLVSLCGCNALIDRQRHVHEEDAGRDAGGMDAGPLDAGAMDGGASDGGASDAGAGDAGPPPDSGPASGANRVFVTSSIHEISGLGGVSGADDLCNAAALREGLPDVGSYVAWLSTSETAAVERLAGSRGWVRPDLQPVGDRPEDLAAGIVFYPPVLNEMGLRQLHFAWTGSTSDGRESPLGTCGDWRSTTGMGRLGFSGGGPGWWTSAFDHPCNNSAAFFCFGTGRNVRVAPPEPVGRLAFVTSESIPGNAGVAAMDALCNREARNSGLAETFVAMVSTSSTPGSLRVGAGLPWVRPDGVRVLENVADLMAGILLAPLSVSLDGTYQEARAWTGGDSPGGPATSTCSDWMASGGLGAFGPTSDVRFYDGAFFDCAVPQRVFCFEP